MANVNRVTLVGRLGKDPERKQYGDGKEYCRFSLATSRGARGKEVTQWHNVVVFSETTARFVTDYVRKGMTIYLEGEIEYRQWDDNGVTKYMTNIVVGQYGGTVQILSDGTSRGEGQAPSYAEASGGAGRARAKPAEPAPANLENDLDDFIPF